MRIAELLIETAGELSVPRFPKIGWWLDHDPVTFYHGTHERNLESILKSGIAAPKEGYTAGWVSLALEPNTAHGYASMSGLGGETQFRMKTFRSAGTKAAHVPNEERVTFVIKIPQNDFMKKMAPMRGAMTDIAKRLTDKDEYQKLVVDGGMSDAEYYARTEIRYPDLIPPKFIVGYTYLKGKK
jgi:hypothetical protein